MFLGNSFIQVLKEVARILVRVTQEVPLLSDRATNTSKWGWCPGVKDVQESVTQVCMLVFLAHTTGSKASRAGNGGPLVPCAMDQAVVVVEEVVEEEEVAEAVLPGSLISSSLLPPMTTGKNTQSFHSDLYTATSNNMLTFAF